MVSDDHTDHELHSLIHAHCPSLSEDQVEGQKESCLRTISRDSSARTNQFDVFARVEGLAEKLRILNKDAVADSLQSRYEELLQLDWKWTPEVLSLFLLLSDRPATHSQKEGSSHLEHVSQPESPRESVEDFDSFVEEDAGIWRNVDFGAEDSEADDEIRSVFSSTSNKDTVSDASLIQESGLEPDSLILPVSNANVSDLLANALWRCEATQEEGGAEAPPQDSFSATELQVVREVIHMLLGLPTTLFFRKDSSPSILCRIVSIEHASSSSVMHLLQAFAIVGDELEKIRQFVSWKEPVPLVQKFQSVLAQRLRAIDGRLNSIQTSIIDSSVDFVVSLLDLYEDIGEATRYIRYLVPVLEWLEKMNVSRRPLGVLEGLFDATCSIQAIGDHEGFQYLASAFFECFQTYLKPLKVWIENGELDQRERVMFITQTNTTAAPESVWDEQFSIVKNEDGSLFAPQFIHIMTSTIFKAGKSVFFLKLLGQDPTNHALAASEKKSMSFENVCGQNDTHLLSPFPELFDSAFSSWVAQCHHLSSSVLRRHLDHSYGLQKSLDALEYVFFSRGGLLSNNIFPFIFNRLDGGKKHWNDSFVLTDLFHDTFAHTSVIDPKNILVQPRPDHGHHSRRSMTVLESVCVNYRLSWPVANILRPKSTSTYQQVFSFLSQSYRARWLLQSFKLPAPDQSPLNKTQAHAIYSCRTRLLHFVNTLLTHLLIMVVDANTKKMRLDIARADDIDAMISIHANYISIIEDQCFLHKKHASLKQAIVSILDVTVLFSDVLTTTTGVTKSESKRQSGEGSATSSDEEESSELIDGQMQRSASSKVDDLQNLPQCMATTDAKLGKIQNTFKQLHAFTTACVQGLSKADDAPYWEVLASNLNSGGMGS